MMDSNNRACPFCRHELARIGKVNQVISGWLDFLNNGMIYYPKNDQDQIVPSQHMPIIEVTSAVVFPTQHCLIHVTNDCRSLLKQMVNNPHRNHYAICVFGQGNESLHDYGVMLQINHVEYSPDVRHSVVQAVGLFRLGISQLTLDENNCYTGDVTRLDDSEFELPSKKYKAPDVITNNNTQDAPLERKLKRIRPCSMRLGSSISSNYQFSMSNNIPVCNYRKTWATSTQFSKPSSPHLLWTYTQPTYAVSPCSKHNITNKIPNPPPPHQKSATTTAIPTLANVDTLLAGDLHPRLVQYLSRMNNEAWLKQYEVYTQQFDRSTLIWWVSNALPLHQEEKLQLLAMQSLKERIMAIIYFMDKWR
jgi:ATP-dependent Lon protease